MTEYPKSVVVTRAADVGKESTGQSRGMTRKAAITNLAPGLCGSVMLAAPHSESDVHTHGDQDTIIYAAQGVGKVSYNGGRDVVEVRQGDFVLIPRWCEHQEINESDEEIVWIITRSGAAPVVKNLDGWGGKEQ